MTTDISGAGTIPRWTVGDRVRKAREVAGMSQTGLADRAGVGRRSLTRYESGESVPRRPQLAAIALATGIALRWLETGEAPHPEPDGEPLRYTARDSNPEPTDYVSNVARFPRDRASIAA